MSTARLYTTSSTIASVVASTIASVIVSLVGLAVGLTSGCSETTSASVVRVLDRPSDVAFGCSLRAVRRSAIDNSLLGVTDIPLTLAACRAQQLDFELPPEYVSNAEVAVSTEIVQHAIFLQSAQGSVAVARFVPRSQANPNSTPIISDSDRFTPGDNTIPFGSLPVGVTIAPSGCHLLSANSSTCDLSSMDVVSALDPERRPHVTRTPVTNADGEPIAAKPRLMIGDPRPSSERVGTQCPLEPDGVLYITYPDCNMVAAVDAGSGSVIAGILFQEDGRIEITDGNVSCGGECGSIAELQELAPRPSTLELQLDGERPRLYIGLDNSSELIIVELTDELLPASIAGIPLEGDVGITQLAVTEPLFDNLGAPLRFVYAITNDGTIRVVEVDALQTECDTQVDTRYLHDELDTSFLPCMPVGDPRTPPRRLGARSPGIHAPGDGKPLDLQFVRLDNTDGDDSAPTSARLMKGYFAYATSSAGRIFIVNVNDERYPDTEPIPPETPDLAFNPVEFDMALALPHRLRDFGTSRSMEFEFTLDHDEDEDTPPQRANTCSFDVVANNLATLRPRMSQDIGRGVLPDQFDSEKGHIQPNMRRVICQEDEGFSPIPELAIMNDLYDHKKRFPDLANVPSSEGWAMIWEGPVSLDASSSAVDGPSIRSGGASVVDTTIELRDAGQAFCRMGVEPFDIVDFLGCNPTLGDFDCSAGETCYVHPRAPSNVGTGMCLPSDQVDGLSNLCEPMLTSLRQYAVSGSVFKDRMTLMERRRVVRTTPVDGCVSSDDCLAHYEVEASYTRSTHPIDLMPLDEIPYTFSCEPDPTRAPGPDTCVMTCDTTDNCEPGYACSDGYCVSGPIPDDACLRAIQRYSARVGDAFAVIGSQTGFLHNRIADPDDGECVADPDGNPLSIGRLPLTAPPCTGDGLEDVTPNPCSTTIDHVEVAARYNLLEGECNLMDGDDAAELFPREAEAIRFANSSFTTHLVDPRPILDLNCNRDRLGEVADYRVVFPGYRLSFDVVGGFTTFTTSNATIANTNAFSLVVNTTSQFLTYPVGIELGPWGRLWVMDQGDRSTSIRSQVVWLSPDFLNDDPTTSPIFYLR